MYGLVRTIYMKLCKMPVWLLKARSDDLEDRLEQGTLDGH